VSTPRRSRAFTLIELLVVIAIITLLISITLPSTSRAREQSRAAVCLSNMRQVGALMRMYTLDDLADQPIPIHPLMMRATGSPWLWMTANDFTWGGRDGQHALATVDSDEIWLSGGAQGYVPPGLDHPGYDMARRPLNQYVLDTGFTESDRDDMPIFQCPSDVGYSSGADVAPSARGVPCYDLFGNSYRANLYSFRDDTGAFSIGPWGHRATTELPGPSELVIFAEPLFFEMVSGNPGARDWHARAGVANVFYADGAARATRPVRDPGLENATAARLDLPPYPPWCNKFLVCSGPGWSLDVWPTPGVRIWGEPGFWTHPFAAQPFVGCCSWHLKKWPFIGYRDHLHAESEE
jgi:prepilin-type N-terminal cleavage/methylation domain-containing protein